MHPAVQALVRISRGLYGCTVDIFRENLCLVRIARQVHAIGRLTRVKRFGMVVKLRERSCLSNKKER